MAEELGWSHTTMGLVQSAFFYGFLIAQGPGGLLSNRLGGATTLPPAVAVWSAATSMLPFTSASMPMLCLSRAVVGLGEAMAPGAIIDMVSRTISKEKRAGAISTAYSGLHFGTMLGLLVSPHIIHTWGWRALFWDYGFVGALWSYAFQLLLKDIEQQDPGVMHLLSSTVLQSSSAQAPSTSSAQAPSTSSGGASTSADTSSDLQVPWRAFLRSGPVQALMFTHFCHNW
jgi:ACS family sodium-dependent inorganic phosphate cotransporter